MSGVTSSSRQRLRSACSRVSNRAASSSSIPSWSNTETESDDENNALRFEITMPSTFRQFVDLPRIPEIAGDARWVFIEIVDDREYMLHMIRKDDHFSFQQGWELVAAVENIQEGQTFMFQIEDESSFFMDNNNPVEYNIPIGFSEARDRSSVITWTSNDYFTAPGTPLTPNVYQAMYAVWVTSSINSPMFVRTIFPTEMD